MQPTARCGPDLPRRHWSGGGYLLQRMASEACWELVAYVSRTSPLGWRAPCYLPCDVLRAEVRSVAPRDTGKFALTRGCVTVRTCSVQLSDTTARPSSA